MSLAIIVTDSHGSGRGRRDMECYQSRAAQNW